MMVPRHIPSHVPGVHLNRKIFQCGALLVLSLCRGDDREVMKLRANLANSGGSTVGTDSLGEGVLFNRGYAHEGSIEALWDDDHDEGHGSFGCGDGGLEDEEVPLDVIKGGGGGGLECRRQQLLRYFGERSKAGGARGMSDRCCDVCYNAGVCFCGYWCMRECGSCFYRMGVESVIFLVD